ncbi:MAG: inositol monophosphatase family protein [Planctomycetota bacterium]|nr:inositol monophosphatase family protein [Planctomycetota bacterium]
MADELLQRLDTALAAVSAAGDAILAHYQRDDLPIEMKRDGTPVTIADREAEQLLRAFVRARYPADALVGEEFGVQEGDSDFRWVFDPIDGTKSFACGVPLFGTLIGVEKRDERGQWGSVIGVVHMPALAETVWAASGHGAWHRTAGKPVRPARVSGVERLEDAVFVTTGREYFEAGRAEHVHERLARACRLTRGWSDCYGLVLVATGRADVWCEPVVHVWDVAPAPPIMREAGGVYTDWAGTPDIRSSTGLAANRAVHAQALGVVRSGTA